MDDGARQIIVDHLLRDQGAVTSSIEIVRDKQSSDRVIVLAHWVEARTSRARRGATGVVRTDGAWHPRGGWSSNAGDDQDHPVWRAWGGDARSMSGWVSDLAAATIRLRDPHGRLEADTVEDGVAILTYDTPFERGSVVELLDEDGNVLQTAPL